MPLGNFIVWIIGFINSVLVPLIFALAFIVFIWGIFQYFIAGGADEEKRKEGKKFALYGIIGFFIMISIWGIVNLLVNSTGFDNKSRPALPTFGTTGTERVNSTFTGCQDDSDCPVNNSCVPMGDHKECFPD